MTNATLISPKVKVSSGRRNRQPDFFGVAFELAKWRVLELEIVNAFNELFFSVVKIIVNAFRLALVNFGELSGSENTLIAPVNGYEGLNIHSVFSFLSEWELRGLKILTLSGWRFIILDVKSE